jgi:uncharacterized membrane protein YbhN (UPF0104 family)
MKRVLVSSAQVVAPIVALVLLAHRFGADAFRPALAVVAPFPMLAALVLGGVATVAQAARWRVVMNGAGHRLGRVKATAECYRACALNSVLPGGIIGDAVRAWRQRTDARHGWRAGADSVVAERACGLCTLLVATAAVLIVEARSIMAAAAGISACVAFVVARPSLRRLTWRERAAVWGWSVVALAALLALTAVAAVTLGVSASPGAMATLGLIILAGMAVPLNVGGWGPREAAAAVAATLVGASPAGGVTVAAGYGLLTTVSVVAPCLALMVPRLAKAVWRSRAKSSSTQTSSPKMNRLDGARSASLSRS